ncbi:esterase/lipase family protein [Bacillus changyiensis]|uniref:esterase/lipase family protein n=1 Tax=Bacillus changyiensis TaxID=3004103 RepID=UPI0022E48B60|nr:hypothetical protein [Bacillus changyiensis]MDA1476260.1 hypothetical protein [Bacillus changyiensis]
MKKWTLLIVALLFLFPQVSNAGGFIDDSGKPGYWFTGKAVEQVDPRKPPIVFVHGLYNSNKVWFKKNDMSKQAWESGYETAYIDLHHDKDMYTNGALLAEKLREMYEHFGRKMIIVSYSKGGIDTQAALTYHDAHQYVEHVITLGTPHHGSQLADLAYSNWAGWLAGILGHKNDGVYSLQTGYMASFRNKTDAHPDLKKTHYFTLAGHRIGHFGSVLFFGGVYLKLFGNNDGAVTETNAMLPYADHLITGNWNHFGIPIGNKTFPTFQALLTKDPKNIQVNTYKKSYMKEKRSYPFVRGGENTGHKTEEFAVEKGVKELTVHWLSDHPERHIKLTDPAGHVTKDFALTETVDVFAGGYVHSAKIKNPLPGKWKMSSVVKQKEAYLFVTTFDSPFDLQIDKIMKTQTSSLTNVKATIRTIRYQNGKQIEKKELKSASVKALQHKLSFKKPGMYSVTIDLSGKTADQTPFNRTIIRSIYVDDKGQTFENPLHN